MQGTCVLSECFQTKLISVLDKQFKHNHIYTSRSIDSYRSHSIYFDMLVEVESSPRHTIRHSHPTPTSVPRHPCTHYASLTHISHATHSTTLAPALLCARRRLSCALVRLGSACRRPPTTLTHRSHDRRHVRSEQLAKCHGLLIQLRQRLLQHGARA